MRTSINMICRYVVDDYKCSCWCVLLGISFFHLALNSLCLCYNFFFSSRRRHTRFKCDWSSDVCSSDLKMPLEKWTQEVNDGKATTDQYFVLKNLAARIDELVAAKNAGA